jgi:hypothetical protein
MSTQYFCKTRFALLALLLQLAACGSSSTEDAQAPGPEPTDPPPPATIDETLGRLGVNTSKTARVDDDGDEYPESYAPLGAVVSVRHLADTSEPDGTRYVVGRGEELLLVGYRPEGQTGVVSVIDDLTSGTESNNFTLSDTLLARRGPLRLAIQLTRSPPTKCPPRASHRLLHLEPNDPAPQ